jgi:predicted transcriptional regulator
VGSNPEAHDKFNAVYDLLAFLNENVAGASAISPPVHLSSGAVRHLLSFMLRRGFVRTAGSYSEFRITALGSAFLLDFQGMRKFLP